MPLITGGKLQALAVASAKRGIALPDVPTTTEAGFANSDYEFWVGAFAPAATPRALVDRLNQEILKALDTAQRARSPQGHGRIADADDGAGIRASSSSAKST